MPHPIRADASIRGASGIAKAGNTNGSERRPLDHVASADRAAAVCLAIGMRATSLRPQYDMIAYKAYEKATNTYEECALATRRHIER